MLLLIPLRFHRRQIHRFNTGQKARRVPYGGTLSLGLKRGAWVRHPCHGVAYVGGTLDGRISLHSRETGRRLTQNARVQDCQVLCTASWRIRSGLKPAKALPIEVQSSRVEATFEHGVLTLTLPKAERLRPKTIKISVGGAAQPIRAQTSSSGAASEGEHAEPAPATDEASAESGRTRQATDGALQTGGAAGPSDETADLSGDTSDTGRRKQSRTSGAR